jgi:hypothetical protein
MQSIGLTEQDALCRIQLSIERGQGELRSSSAYEVSPLSSIL